MTVQTGWYEDPWGLAPLRWWDGEAWTGHTDGAFTSAPDHQVLDRLLLDVERVAIVDVETTGLYNTDRIVEVAVITMDRSGTVIDEFESLVHPGRDVGPTWLHQIDAAMVADAPTFDEVAHHVAARIDGAICVAHNLPFDRRMLGNELAASGIDVDWGDGLDTLTVTGCKLGVACQERGIAIERAHSALCDARATAELLTHVAHAFDQAGAPTTVRPIHATPMRVHTRAGAAHAEVPAPYLAALARGVHSTPDVAPYVDLLDKAVVNLRLTADERTALAALAADLGLDAMQINRAHRDFVNGLIDAAIDDLIVTDGEYDQLCRAAALLDIDPDVVARRTNGLRATTGTLALTDGLTVCFTGSPIDPTGSEIPRETLEALARRRGLRPVGSVTASGCGLLVAADAASRSGKAGKARRFGIPIASVDDFLVSIDAGTSLPITRLAEAGVALVCGECGGSWLAQRRSTRPICTDCREATSPTVSRPRSAAGQTARETLTCSGCDRTWERTRTSGRKPTRCPACA